MDKGKGILIEDDDNEDVPINPRNDNERDEVKGYEASVARAFADDIERWNSFSQTITNYVNDRVPGIEAMEQMDVLFQGNDHLKNGLNRFLCLKYLTETGEKRYHPLNKLDYNKFSRMERFVDRELTKYNTYIRTAKSLLGHQISVEEYRSTLIELFQGHEDLLAFFRKFIDIVDNRSTY